jgi:hypothetical protein
VVLVTGPPLAGVTSVVAALRERVPEPVLVDAELGPDEVPAAVVVVVSAVAPMTESDCGQVDVAAAQAYCVIGAVSKVDAHRGWHGVLAANRATMRARSPRYRAVPWVAVAAAPDVGPPNVDELVESLGDALRDPTLVRRNLLHTSDIRVAQLRSARAALLRERRGARSERALALRGGLHQARVELSRFVRQRCSVLRADFRARAAALPRGGRPRFEATLRGEVETVLEELAGQLRTRARELAGALDVAEPACPDPVDRPQLTAPPVASRQGERRLTMVLGAGFGLGVAMAVSRLLGGLAQHLAGVALAVGALCGLALTVWLVTTRAQLQERALLDRWVTEIVTTARSHGEELVVSWLLAAELGLAAGLAARDEADATELSERADAIDAELRALARLTAGSQKD